MKKKQYNRPSLMCVELKQTSCILAASGTPSLFSIDLQSAGTPVADSFWTR